ncbi:MAG TPA: DNA-processing protein DprA [Thermoanaerobaculia bacterium]|nr:DNA-processing protein DprA [Thermoanaerobaculia bacterium]
MNDAPTERDLMIALSLLPFLSSIRARLLRDHFDPLTTVCHASTAFLAALLKLDPAQAELVKYPLRNAGKSLSAPASPIVTLADDDYPRPLREIYDPPLALWYRGDLALARRPCFAVVGSRRASPYAINATSHLVRQLVSAGLVIVSGLARGVDGAAHTAALEAGGATIAVLGTGIDLVYPKSHGGLAKRIEEEALLISEFAPGTPPFAANFPVRNRVISGLALGTLIVEATGRSGSLITARMAAEQGREVFAVPGSIFAPGSEGTHRLVQYGAKLVHDVDDIFSELRGEWKATVAPAEPPPQEPVLREVLAALSREEALHVDATAAKLGRPVAALAQSLLQLELDGWVRAVPGGRYVRVR